MARPSSTLRGAKPSARAGRRYVLCGEVAGFGSVLERFATLMGSPHRVTALPPGTTLPDDAQARALGFAPRSVDDGLAITAAWLADR